MEKIYNQNQDIILDGYDHSLTKETIKNYNHYKQEILSMITSIRNTVSFKHSEAKFDCRASSVVANHKQLMLYLSQLITLSTLVKQHVFYIDKLQNNIQNIKPNMISAVTNQEEYENLQYRTYWNEIQSCIVKNNQHTIEIYIQQAKPEDLFKDIILKSIKDTLDLLQQIKSYTQNMDKSIDQILQQNKAAITQNKQNKDDLLKYINQSITNHNGQIIPKNNQELLKRTEQAIKKINILEGLSEQEKKCISQDCVDMLRNKYSNIIQILQNMEVEQEIKKIVQILDTNTKDLLSMDDLAQKQKATIVEVSNKINSIISILNTKKEHLLHIAKVYLLNDQTEYLLNTKKEDLSYIDSLSNEKSPKESRKINKVVQILGANISNLSLSMDSLLNKPQSLQEIEQQATKIIDELKINLLLYINDGLQSKLAPQALQEMEKQIQYIIQQMPSDEEKNFQHILNFVQDSDFITQTDFINQVTKDKDIKNNFHQIFIKCYESQYEQHKNPSKQLSDIFIGYHQLQIKQRLYAKTQVINNSDDNQNMCKFIVEILKYMEKIQKYYNQNHEYLKTKANKLKGKEHAQQKKEQKKQKKSDQKKRHKEQQDQKKIQRQQKKQEKKNKKKSKPTINDKN